MTFGECRYRKLINFKVETCASRQPVDDCFSITACPIVFCSFLELFVVLLIKGLFSWSFFYTVALLVKKFATHTHQISISSLFSKLFISDSKVSAKHEKPSQVKTQKGKLLLKKRHVLIVFFAWTSALSVTVAKCEEVPGLLSAICKARQTVSA